MRIVIIIPLTQIYDDKQLRVLVFLQRSAQEQTTAHCLVILAETLSKTILEPGVYDKVEYESSESVKGEAHNEGPSNYRVGSAPD